MRVSIARALAFVGLFACLQLTWQALRDGPVYWVVVHDWTVVPAVWVVNRLTPSVHAHAVNFTLSAPGGGLNVVNGCEGLEALFLLLSALLIAPIVWPRRIAGMLLGTLLVFAANQLRLFGLFYAYRADPGLFDVLHSTVTPIALIVLIACYFYAWLDHSSRAHVAGAA